MFNIMTEQDLTDIEAAVAAKPPSGSPAVDEILDNWLAIVGRLVHEHRLLKQDVERYKAWIGGPELMAAYPDAQTFAEESTQWKGP